ncbi:hypothetical protein ACLIN3_05385 [Pseudomonas orientalis]|uniref:hypothetical protein n=1 Tax=Pseudomonas orientalis TaxID=76758 RepID=UPI0039888A81
MTGPVGETIKELNCPRWLEDASWLQEKQGLKVAACESRGENSIDLMAAIYLATLDQQTTLNLRCFDDQRDPSAAQALAQRLASDGVKVIIGHFAATAALSAARVYDNYPLLFLAPGCSDPRLCSSTGPGKHAVRFFGNDDEQADCLLGAIPAGARVRILAQQGNYGYRLGKVLHQRLTAHASAATIDFLNAEGEQCRSRILDTDLVLIAGSSEFAKRVASALPLKPGQTLLLSDDCRVEMATELRLSTYTRVAALQCQLGSPDDDRFARLIERADNLIGRPPGPYFLTSYLACQALCISLRDSPEASTDLLRNVLLRQRIESPYGTLEFDHTGNMRGHRWILNTATALLGDNCLECS